ncbi:outer membrane protein [Rhodoligotrophos defluvii]|uniref:outer membrane protein n=1 Tax=Rhodoligotrophos defluvii TaxID=2561934 RepID=UPI001484D7A6|nr:outer membrane beta-barrel protein [Rhodoligotrophos defluvii]
MIFVRWAAGLTAAAAVLGVVPAFAADLPAYEPPAAVSIPAPAPLKPWQGFSLGLLGTYGFGKGNELSGLNVNGPMFGGLAGIHGQVGNWVLGAEFDGSFGAIGGSRAKAKAGAPANDVFEAIRPLGPVDGALTLAVLSEGLGKQPGAAAQQAAFARESFTYPAKTSIDQFYSFRGRVGYAFDNVLLYGTGGIAVAHVKLKSDHPVLGAYDDENFGFTPVVGGGVEYKFTDSLSLRAEYLYAMPFKVAMKQKQEDWSAPNRTNASFDGTHMIRAGISYHLPIN